jgi:tetratricopeptide (TPR) repeat protein
MARRKPPAQRQQDLFQRTFTRLFQELSGAGVAFTGVILAGLLVMAILWGVSASNEEAQAAAWRKAAEAFDTRDSKDQLTRIEEVMKEIAGTDVHPTVAVVLAFRLHEKAINDTALSSAKRQELLKRARSLYQGVIRNSPEHPLAAKAQANLARVLEDSGEDEAAYEAFRKAAEDCQNTGLAFTQGKLLWGQARCAHKMGKVNEAIRLLNRATSRPGAGANTWKRLAQHLLDSLRKMPEKDNRLIKGVDRDTPPAAEKPDGETPDEKKTPSKG